MDLTVLDIGLRNGQLSTVNCFLKIQIETFRLSLGFNHSNGNESETSSLESLLNDWEQVFAKLISVITANITNSSSKQFALYLGRTTFQTCNHLLEIVSEANFDTYSSNFKLKFFDLLIKNNRLIRLLLKVSDSSQKQPLVEYKETKLIDFDNNANELEAISKAIRYNSISIAQHWLKNRNSDKKWDQIVKNVIQLSLYYLRNNDFGAINTTLSQLGLPVLHVIQQISLFTSDKHLREMLFSKFGSQFTKHNISEMKLIVDYLEKKSNVYLTICWIIEMERELQERVLIKRLLEKPEISLTKFTPEIVWNFLIDQNDSETLMAWIGRLSGISSTNFQFDWIINQTMIDTVYERASILTKESVLNSLCMRGCFPTKELNDFQQILYRLGRINTYEPNEYLTKFYDHSSRFSLFSIKSDIFSEKLIKFCLDNNLYEFYYSYCKYSEATLPSVNTSFTDLLKISINCSDSQSNEQILSAILITAQYIHQSSDPLAIESLFGRDFYLMLISLTYSSLNICDIFKSGLKDNKTIQMIKSEYPLIYSCLNELTNTDTHNDQIHEEPNVYILLKDSIPFDVSKMFCWQSTNNIECCEDSINSMVFNELPNFSHTRLADLYGLKANLTFTYYLNQGRVVEAYNRFITNRKSLNSKIIELACRRAALVAYNDTTNNNIAVACIVFQQLLSGDSSQTLLHLTVAKMIMSFAADFLSLNARQQQIELSSLLKRSHYYYDKRAAAKLLQLTVAAINRKYKNFMEIQIEECFDWKIVVKFAALHQIKIPADLDFLTKCAVSDNWLMFTICCQIHQYSRELVFEGLKQFNNECIADHLHKAFHSTHTILTESSITDRSDSSIILNKRSGRKSTNARFLRNNLYSKLGVNKTVENNDNGRQAKMPLKSSSSTIDSDDISIASETDYNAVETISVISSSNTSEGEETLTFNVDNCPKDLFQIILNCQSDTAYDARKTLLCSSIPLSNPILSLISCSSGYDSENFKIINAFSCWLLSSVDFDIRKQFCEKYPNLDPLNWSCDENFKMIDLVMRETKNYFIFLKGLKIFNINVAPVIDLLNFMFSFFCQKDYYEVQSLKSFQDNLWKYEEPINTDNVFLTKDWIQNCSVIILSNALKNTKSYELIILLRHYDFARIQGSFSPQIKVDDYRKIYRLCQCLFETSIEFPIKDVLSDEITSLSTDDQNYCQIIESVISSLQKKSHFQEARNFANIAEIETIELTINEWTLRASADLNSTEFWDLCWESLTGVDPSLESAFKVLHKFINQVSSVVVKCLLVFKCLIASLKQENYSDCIVYETMLWKCVVQIEKDETSEANNASKWSIIWSDILVFIKSHKHIKNSYSLVAIDSITLTIELSKTLDTVIENLLNNGCIEKAHEVALIFKYSHQDLDIILACDNISNGLINNLNEAPLSVQLRTKAIGHLSQTEYTSDFSDEQREKICFIESISSDATIGRKSCQRVLVYFKISCVLGLSYNDIEKQELDDLELIKSLISSHSSQALLLAKELIILNNICEEDIASIICKETLTSLENSHESSSNGSTISRLENQNTSFLSLVRLLNDTTILGTKLLIQTENDTFHNPINYIFFTELYIKAHECFSLACDVKGIALVLRKSRVLITQTLVPSKDFNSILILLTGIGRYSEMTYCFDILKENNQFELLLSKRIEKVPQLRIALLDYLKGDKEMFPLVALRFCLYREIAENHELSAKKMFTNIQFPKTSNSTNIKDQLETIMFEFIDAYESYTKAGCHSHADSCGKTAQLISLQVHYLAANKIIINMKANQIAEFIENNDNFFEALIVADAYQHNTSWPNAFFNNVIINGNNNYFSDYISCKEINSSLVEELAQKYSQYITIKSYTNDKQLQMKRSLQKLIPYIDDYETQLKIAWDLNLVETSKRLLSDESGSYLRDLRRNRL